MRVLLEIVEFISITTFVTGLILNLLLLYLIRSFSTKELGTYKYLLEIFAVYDIYLVIVHHVINPKSIPSPTAWSAVSDREFGFYELFPFYSSCYAVPFVLLNIHLLYRYWAITDPEKIALFSQPAFIVLLVLFTVVSQICWFVGCFIGGQPADKNEIISCQSLFRQEYERDIHEGFFIANFWNQDKVVIRSLCLLLMGSAAEITSFSVAATLASMTYRAIREARHICETIRTFQLQILIAACAQTLTPTIFVHIPYFLSLVIPFLRLNSPAFSALYMPLLSFFPCVDAVVIILLIKPYRDGLLGIIYRRKIQCITARESSLISSTIHPTPIHII